MRATRWQLPTRDGPSALVIVPQPRRNYRGWSVYGDGDTWAAYRFGVRMRANSESLLIAMIDSRPERA